jgi:hypothetical protein
VNQLNNTKIDNTQTKPVEPIALLDCGQASRVTKGFPFFYFLEYGTPPYDRLLY